MDPLENAFGFVVGDWYNNITDGHEQTFEIEEIFIHPRYNHQITDWDLSLFKVF